MPITNPGADNIVFDIPASTAANLNVPVPGFDPVTQTWTINLAVPCRSITHPVSIDGYTQANVGVPFRYPDQVSSAAQSLLVGGVPTGGSFTLTTVGPAAGRHHAADPLQRNGRAGPVRPRVDHSWPVTSR